MKAAIRRTPSKANPKHTRAGTFLWSAENDVVRSSALLLNLGRAKRYLDNAVALDLGLEAGRTRHTARRGGRSAYVPSAMSPYTDEKTGGGKIFHRIECPPTLSLSKWARKADFCRKANTS